LPAKPLWLLRLPRIQEELAAIETPIIDRSCVEKLFRVRRRRAIELMGEFGGFQSGKTFLVEKAQVQSVLTRIAEQGYEHELGRRTKLVTEIERVKKLLPARDIRLVVTDETAGMGMDDLPPGVQLRPGELKIEFGGVEDLLRKLFELSQAIVNDYRKFETACGATGD